MNVTGDAHRFKTPNLLTLDGKSDLFRESEMGQRAFPLCTIADPDEAAAKMKIVHTEMHPSLESVIECLVDDFVLAAEEFIFSLSKKLGLKTVTQRSVREKRLAA